MAVFTSMSHILINSKDEPGKYNLKINVILKDLYYALDNNYILIKMVHTNSHKAEMLLTITVGALSLIIRMYCVCCFCDYTISENTGLKVSTQNKHLSFTDFLICAVVGCIHRLLTFTIQHCSVKYPP